MKRIKTCFWAAGMMMLLLSGCKREEELLIWEETLSDNYTSDGYAEESSFAKEEQRAEVVVYVCGEVNAPGIVTLPEGSRIHDAVETAGGMTDEAAVNHVNLATKLQDGERIYIPSEEEIQLQELQKQEQEKGLVNINTADEKELCTLPGVGESKAMDILFYREQNGPFRTIEDIMKVPGIKENLFYKIKAYIVVE